VRIQVNPTALASYGLSLEDLRLALSQANVDQAKGSFDGAHQAYIIGANDQLLSSAAYRPLIIAYRDGAPVRLADVAAVLDGAENSKQAAWANEHPAVILNIKRQPGANIIDVADRVKAVLPDLSASLPGAVQMKTLADRTTTIRASVHDVKFTLALTVGLVVLVIFLFLRSVRATLIPSFAVPLSIVATFGVMYLLGYSLNNLTLMALTISTGFVVDDAIVMVENISRYIEQGDQPLEAALKGSAQIGFTILSLTVSLVAVLIPLLFMGEVIGRLFREFAVTLAVTIVVSALVSLTLTPMLSARLMRRYEEGEKGWFYRLAEGASNSVLAVYARTLQFVLRFRAATLFVTVATLAATVYLYVLVPKGFFPVQDTGMILGVSEAAQNISFDAMARKQQELGAAILKDPAVENIASFVGIDGTNQTVNSGRIQISLRPLEQRDSAQEVIRRLQDSVRSVNGAGLFLQPAQDLTIEDRVTRTEFQYSLEDSDARELSYWTPKFIDKLRSLPELQDVATDQLNQGLLATLVIDRDTASRLGILPAAIDNTLYDAFGQRQISTMYAQHNQYRVVLEVNPQFQQKPEDLRSIYVRSASGQQIPLSTFTRFEQSSAPLAVNHQGQFPVTTLSFNLAPGVSLGDAVNAVERAKGDLGVPLSVQAKFQGTAAAFLRSLASEPVLILAAIIAVYIVLGILYESFIHPITIISTLPSAGVGALLALMLCGKEFGIIALIGIILLIGIVKKNAILMIDFALEAERKDGKSPLDAIYEASLLRFRPIMMTTMAALLGGLPLALGTGVGSELRKPLGITIVGGLILSQLLTLYTTPVVYLAFDSLRPRSRRSVALASHAESTAECD
jgi:multidrug efflux pump